MGHRASWVFNICSFKATCQRIVLNLPKEQEKDEHLDLLLFCLHQGTRQMRGYSLGLLLHCSSQDIDEMSKGDRKVLFYILSPIIEGVVISKAGFFQAIVFWSIGLDDLIGRSPTSRPSYNLRKKSKGPLRCPKIRRFRAYLQNHSNKTLLLNSNPLSTIWVPTKIPFSPQMP